MVRSIQWHCKCTDSAERQRPARYSAGVFLLVLSSLAAPAQADNEVYLSDRNAGISLQSSQQWGDFGWDTAAARTGTVGSPLQIGQKTYERGLGLHANGEIVVALRGQCTNFRCSVGVQWQGGKKGSVVFCVAVDGETVFTSKPMSDSDPAQEVDIPIAGAQELRLIAQDGGDGFGCDMANWVDARLVRDPNSLFFGEASVSLNGVAADASRAGACGLTLIAGETGPQAAVMETAKMLTACVRSDEEVRLTIPVQNLRKPCRVLVDAWLSHGSGAELELSVGGNCVTRAIRSDGPVTLTVEIKAGAADTEIVLVTRGEPQALASGARGGAADIEIVPTTRGVEREAAVRWYGLRCVSEDQTLDVPIQIAQIQETIPPPVLPQPRPAMERELIEWDWRMQDGIGTRREARSWEQAIQTTFQHGDQLILDLNDGSAEWTALVAQWEACRNQLQSLSSAGSATDIEWESLWRQVHTLRRQIVFQNPLASFGPLVFAKRVPSAFSHQLMQYSGRCARPGGGLFVLEAPGDSMACRQLATLPEGSYMQPDVSWDGQRVLFAFCETEESANWRTNTTQLYHLFEVNADGTDLRQLTDDAYDDFSPTYLPDGKILFLSTRRGGFHRCGRGPCPVHTMALMEADGSNPRVISFHETHEWDPAVLNDGRIIYTRWDYVDRHAVHYQQLWSVRPDGSDVRIYYGNNTLNPVGVWEARPIPGSNRVMATAAAHHAMTAGSIISLDVTQGIDGLQPVTRLTRDALFPESEFPVQRWHATAGIDSPPVVPVEEIRWPGHCYRTPYPLSEDYFLAAYSFDPLIGEPHANTPNMFGIYLVDRFGNKELIYRDVAISSLWPIPLRPRHRPPALPSLLAAAPEDEGSFLLQNVYDSWPVLPVERGSIKQLRIVQVLPKTTPNADTPRVGLAHASPGKQVLGTVPVEPDGSAYFRAPAKIALAFQALDERGMAVQTMRSLTYLQPGEHTSCVGCHEHRTNAPQPRLATLAGQRAPSAIAPGPDGSRPFNYAILVQPVLEKHCVRCHQGPDADGGVDLSGTPAGEFTASYQALAPLVSFSEWKGTPQANQEPLTHPDTFGARASPLMHLLLDGHEDVKLSEEEMERLVTWMDTNALFYGTFDPAAQALQRRGERIPLPFD